MAPRTRRGHRGGKDEIRVGLTLRLTLTQEDRTEIDAIMAAAVPFGGPSPGGMT